MIRKKKHYKTITYFLVGILLLGVLSPSFAQKRKKKKDRIERVIRTGKSYIGTPYKWGGTARSGIDCSGLIYNSYKTIGINLPRTAKAQSKVGSKRSWNGLKKGDLVYFKFKNKKNKWYHSGMITYVNKEKILFLHASSSKGVIESNLMSDYYRKNVRNFRRVIR